MKWVDLFTCFLCGKEGRSPPLRRCSQCEIAYYCSKTCQRGHWKVHKAACVAAGDSCGGILTSSDPYTSPNTFWEMRAGAPCTGSTHEHSFVKKPCSEVVPPPKRLQRAPVPRGVSGARNALDALDRSVHGVRVSGAARSASGAPPGCSRAAAAEADSHSAAVEEHVVLRNCPYESPNRSGGALVERLQLGPRWPACSGCRACRGSQSAGTGGCQYLSFGALA